MKFNQEKAGNGYYIGLTEWLNQNVGQLQKDYFFITQKDSPSFVDSIKIIDPKKELLAILRWGE